MTEESRRCVCNDLWDGRVLSWNWISVEMKRLSKRWQVLNIECESKLLLLLLLMLSCNYCGRWLGSRCNCCCLSSLLWWTVVKRLNGSALNWMKLSWVETKVKLQNSFIISTVEQSYDVLTNPRAMLTEGLDRDVTQQTCRSETQHQHTNKRNNNTIQQWKFITQIQQQFLSTEWSHSKGKTSKHNLMSFDVTQTSFRPSAHSSFLALYNYYMCIPCSKMCALYHRNALSFLVISIHPHLAWTICGYDLQPEWANSGLVRLSEGRGIETCTRYKLIARMCWIETRRILFWIYSLQWLDHSVSHSAFIMTKWPVKRSSFFWLL